MTRTNVDGRRARGPRTRARSFVGVPALSLTLAFATLALPGPVAAFTSVAGVVSEGCERPFDAQAESGWLLAFKLGSVEAPDLLFDASSTGGGRVGAASLDGAAWGVPANWRVPVGAADVIVAVVVMDGRIAIDSGSIDATAGDLGVSSVQVVGAAPGAMAPRVSPTPFGHVVEIASLRELGGPSDVEGCSLAGSPEHGRAVVEGWNLYRLPADEWPAPSLDDFLLHGFVGHACLHDLDFGVRDAGDGAGDLESDDVLSVLNPDGLPETGDEVLVFRDTVRTPVGRLRENAPEADRSYWYRLQPVLRGAAEWFDEGLLSRNGVPSTRLDRDGDGVLESVDVLADGVVEFADPSGHGLGLLHAGGMLSSPEPALAEPFPSGDRDGDGLPDTWELAEGLDPDASNAELDSDSDGLGDVEEAQIGSSPLRADTDGAGEDDRREVLWGRSPLNAHDDVVLADGALLGDVTPPGAPDGRRDIGDVVSVLRMAVGLAEHDAEQGVRADVAPARSIDDSAVPRVEPGGDGKVDVGDAVMLLNAVVGLSTLAE